MIVDSAPVFELEDAGVGFPTVKALDGVSLRIARGEQVAILGPSGSGKTTLLHLLNGSTRATAGRVLVDGRDTATLRSPELRRLRSEIGFVHQAPSLVPNVRVIQNVLAGGMGRLPFRTALRQLIFATKAEAFAVHLLLERVGIEEKLYERTDRLSGGQQQRVAIARALYQQPEAILADEPVSNIDPERARQTVRLLKEVTQRDEALTLVMSLHNLAIAREFFPRLIGLRAGRLIFDRPAHSVTKSDFRSLYRLIDEPSGGG